tara:strand:+ start:2259 stop:2528 length:270 start_codon:yes stop_codon:yes gene_type:complete
MLKIDDRQNPLLTDSVEADSSKPLKEFVVNYVGEAVNPEDGNVTVEMIIEVLAGEFPEFVLALAEENWIRGYHQALTDVEAQIPPQHEE